jgi:hypothetical protein
MLLGRGWERMRMGQKNAFASSRANPSASRTAQPISKEHALGRNAYAFPPHCEKATAARGALAPAHERVAALVEDHPHSVPSRPSRAAAVLLLPGLRGACACAHGM